MSRPDEYVAAVPAGDVGEGYPGSSARGKVTSSAATATGDPDMSTTTTTTTTDLTPASLALFLAYVEDAPNWAGTPMVGGNVGGTRQERGNLTQLKRAGLITTNVDRGETWVYFTDQGIRLAHAHGLDPVNGPIATTTGDADMSTDRTDDVMPYRGPRTVIAGTDTDAKPTPAGAAAIARQERAALRAAERAAYDANRPDDVMPSMTTSNPARKGTTTQETTDMSTTATAPKATRTRKPAAAAAVAPVAAKTTRTRTVTPAPNAAQKRAAAATAKAEAKAAAAKASARSWTPAERAAKAAVTAAKANTKPGGAPGKPISLQEAAEAVGLHTMTLRQHIFAGHIYAWKPEGSRGWLMTLQEVKRYLKSREAGK